MSRRTTRRPRGPSRNGRAESKRTAAMDLPSLDNNLTVRKKFRFLVTVDANTNPIILTEKDLSITGGVVNYTTTESYRLFNQFRLERVEAWSPHPVAGVTTLSIETAPTSVTSTIYKSDTSINVSVPAHVIVNMPNPRIFAVPSLATDFPNTKVVSIYCPTDTVVDITMTFKAYDSNTPAVAFYPHPGVIGKISYPAINISTASPFSLVPVGRPT